MWLAIILLIALAGPTTAQLQLASYDLSLLSGLSDGGQIQVPEGDPVSGEQALQQFMGNLQGITDEQMASAMQLYEQNIQPDMPPPDAQYFETLLAPASQPPQHITGSADTAHLQQLMDGQAGLQAVVYEMPSADAMSDVDNQNEVREKAAAAVGFLEQISAQSGQLLATASEQQRNVLLALPDTIQQMRLQFIEGSPSTTEWQLQVQELWYNNNLGDFIQQARVSDNGTQRTNFVGQANRSAVMDFDNMRNFLPSYAARAQDMANLTSNRQLENAAAMMLEYMRGVQQRSGLAPVDQTTRDSVNSFVGSMQPRVQALLDQLKQAVALHSSGRRLDNQMLTQGADGAAAIDGTLKQDWQTLVKDMDEAGYAQLHRVAGSNTPSDARAQQLNRPGLAGLDNYNTARRALSGITDVQELLPVADKQDLADRVAAIERLVSGLQSRRALLAEDPLLTEAQRQAISETSLQSVADHMASIRQKLAQSQHVSVLDSAGSEARQLWQQVLDDLKLTLPNIIAVAQKNTPQDTFNQALPPGDRTRYRAFGPAKKMFQAAGFDQAFAAVDNIDEAQMRLDAAAAFVRGINARRAEPAMQQALQDNGITADTIAKCHQNISRARQQLQSNASRASEQDRQAPALAAVSLASSNSQHLKYVTQHWPRVARNLMQNCIRKIAPLTQVNTARDALQQSLRDFAAKRSMGPMGRGDQDQQPDRPAQRGRRVGFNRNFTAAREFVKGVPAAQLDSMHLPDNRQDALERLSLLSGLMMGLQARRPDLTDITAEQTAAMELIPKWRQRMRELRDQFKQAMGGATITMVGAPPPEDMCCECSDACEPLQLNDRLLNNFTRFINNANAEGLPQLYGLLRTLPQTGRDAARNLLLSKPPGHWEEYRVAKGFVAQHARNAQQLRAADEPDELRAKITAVCAMYRGLLHRADALSQLEGISANAKTMIEQGKLKQLDDNCQQIRARVLQQRGVNSDIERQWNDFVPKLVQNGHADFVEAAKLETGIDRMSAQLGQATPAQLADPQFAGGLFANVDQPQLLMALDNPSELQNLLAAVQTLGANQDSMSQLPAALAGPLQQLQQHMPLLLNQAQLQQQGQRSNDVAVVAQGAAPLRHTLYLLMHNIGKAVKVEPETTLAPLKTVGGHSPPEQLDMDDVRQQQRQQSSTQPPPPQSHANPIQAQAVAVAACLALLLRV